MFNLKLLAFAAMMGLYLKWIYGSPFSPKPKQFEKSLFRRSVPLILFLVSGISLTFSLLMQERYLFFIFFGLSAACLIAAPLITLFDRPK